MRRPVPVLYLLLAGLLLAGSVGADERILSFHSDITVNADASLVVTETLRVQVEGKVIRRGILRDFPTEYQDPYGNHYRVGFQVLAVERNGEPEPWSTEHLDNGERIRIGRADVFLPSGVHTYRIRYRTERQLGFFEDHDELYWNVTGTGWPFPIDQASATITLPSDVSVQDLRTDVYTGRQGETGTEAFPEILDGRNVSFHTTRGLPPQAGLTVVLGWPKGLVVEPGATQNVRWFLVDNAAVLVMLIGLAVPLAWYLWVWNRAGRDPRKGVIIPRFAPPPGLTPAGCRYVLDMGLDRACFTAAVISLGVKGYLRIDEQDDTFFLYREAGQPSEPASPGEQAVFDALLAGQDGWIELDQENHEFFSLARSGLKDALAREHKGRLFNLNTLYALPAVGFTLLAVLAAIPLQGSPAAWISFMLLSVIMHILFLFLLRAPTRIGRRVMDEIEGFRMYLDTAERDRLQRMRSPELTPELFEKFLPYAFALGVENSWCRRFQREFPDAASDDGYQPGWYAGRLGRGSSMNRIASGLGSGLSSAIASASSPPGSSSGGGGGGSSGGGGGGGGGGGW